MIGSRGDIIPNMVAICYIEPILSDKSAAKVATNPVLPKFSEEKVNEKGEIGLSPSSA